jgi:hypothetical protein
MLRNVRSRRRDFPALYFLEGIMSPPRIHSAPEMVAEAKHLFEETSMPRPDIAAMMGIGLDNVAPASPRVGVAMPAASEWHARLRACDMRRSV